MPGRPEAHVVGEFRRLQIAELPAHDTPFVGQDASAIPSCGSRPASASSVSGSAGKLRPAYPDTEIQSDSVLVVAGTASQIAALNALLPHGRGARPPPVLVIGAGKVGQAAAQALKQKGLPRARDRPHARRPLAPIARRRRRDLSPATPPTGGCSNAPASSSARSVVLTTNDDAMNIYLAVYCRRLNPELRIVSRITHERNLEAIHRAGADFVLSYTTLGVEAVMSLLHGYPPVLLGEGVELFSVPVPASLAGTPAQRLGHRLADRAQRRRAAAGRRADGAADVGNAAAGRRGAADAGQPRAAGGVRRGVR